MSATTRRTRKTSPFGPDSGFYFKRPTSRLYYANGSFDYTLSTDGDSGLRGIQITESEGHVWPNQGKTFQDVGGPFYTRKAHLGYMSHRDVFLREGSGSSLINDVAGDVLSPVSPPSFQLEGNRGVSGLPDPSSDEKVLIALGTEAIAAVSPVTPMMSLPTMIGELVRDGLPTIMGLQTLKGKGKPSSVADDYLNFQFGVKPLLNDLKDLGSSILNADKVLAQLERDNGKMVRRRMNFDTEKTVVEENLGKRPLFSHYGNQVKFHGGSLDSVSGTVIKTTTTSKKRWFSGAFTYYLPSSSERDSLGRMAVEAEKLFGLVPDASDVWNLLPWSWLSDWFFDIGPILQNVSNAQNFGQVLRYGYMMEHTIVKYTYTVNDCPSTYLDGRPVVLEIHDEVKKRIPATPYGFGVSWEDFSPYQLSIIAALGITRGSQTAR